MRNRWVSEVYGVGVHKCDVEIEEFGVAIVGPAVNEFFGARYRSVALAA